MQFLMVFNPRTASGQRRAYRRIPVWLALAIGLWFWVGTAYRAQAERPCEPSSLVVVTSFPESLYTTLRQEFQIVHPEIDVRVIHKKTAAAISFIQQTSSPPPDLFWASSPDAFEILKKSGHLQPYRPRSATVPPTILNYPIHDPEGYYSGFAISGYGMMWNRPYLQQHHLKTPSSWADLTGAHYFGHIGMSTASRSGTTHMAVESILQYHGWVEGWKILLEIGGNLATVTARSFGVPDGVNNGRFGVGIAIDFFGLSAKASGFPVGFTYSRESALLPASVAVLKAACNPQAAFQFVDFLLSPQGQRLLFLPHIRRLPVDPVVYRDSPADFPNPFKLGLRSELAFNSNLSQQRYNLVNALFDRLITYRHNTLRRTWQAIHEAEDRRQHRHNRAAGELLERARLLATWLPVDGDTAEDPSFTSIFVRPRRGQPLPPRQAELEAQWEKTSIRKLKQARDLAHQAMTMMK